MSNIGQSINDKKLAVIGSGNIGGMVAYTAGIKGFSDVILLDLDEGTAKAKALDLSHCAAMNNWNTQFIGTSDYAHIKGVDVVVVTAGMPRKSGMMRADLLAVNSQIICEVALNVHTFAHDAFVIVITNPLDAMVSFFQQCSGIPHHMVVGMAGELDNSRFRTILAKEVGVHTSDIQSVIMGDHGAFMFPALSNTTIMGKPVYEMINTGNLSLELLREVFNRTKNAGAEIVSLLKSGSAYYAPAAISTEMAVSYCCNEKRVFCAAAYLNGEYGIHGIYAGVPTVIGKGGVERVNELRLTPDESDKFLLAVSEIRSLLKLLPKTTTV